eukprot:1265718-Amphidinium_carterae.1
MGNTRSFVWRTILLTRARKCFAAFCALVIDIESTLPSQTPTPADASLQQRATIGAQLELLLLQHFHDCGKTGHINAPEAHFADVALHNLLLHSNTAGHSSAVMVS